MLIENNTSRAFVLLEQGETYPDFIFVQMDRKRKFHKVECCRCESIFYLRRKSIKNYCSDACRLSDSRVISTCSYCGNEFPMAKSRERNSKSGLYFCSRLCKDIAQRIENGILKISHYKDGLTTYRALALSVHGALCNRCGYDENKAMLDVHHKDENRENNKSENLEVLCVWCHALETRKNWKDFGV